jgi:ABC-type sugar transport system substrate-binding protein
MSAKGKIIICIVLLVVLGGFMAFAGGKEEEVKFAYISTRGVGSPWNDAHEDAIAKFAEERGWTLYQYDCQMDIEVMISQIEEAITLEPDVMGILDIDDVALGPPACKVHEAGIPVISSMGLLMEEYWPCLAATTGASFIEQGRATGELMYKGLVEKHGDDLNGKKICILQGYMQQTAAVERYDGFVERFTELAPEVEILDVQVGNWDQAQGLTITETWLTNYPQIDGIAAANDGMALGAVEAADEAGRLDEIIIVAVDATQESLVSISEGRQYGTVLQDPVGAALLVIQVAEQILAGEEPEFVNLLPAPQISPDNVDEYLN